MTAWSTGLSVHCLGIEETRVEDSRGVAFMPTPATVAYSGYVDDEDALASAITFEVAELVREWRDADADVSDLLSPPKQTLAAGDELSSQADAQLHFVPESAGLSPDLSAGFIALLRHSDASEEHPLFAPRSPLDKAGTTRSEVSGGASRSEEHPLFAAAGPRDGCRTPEVKIQSEASNQPLGAPSLEVRSIHDLQDRLIRWKVSPMSLEQLGVLLFHIVLIRDLLQGLKVSFVWHPNVQKREEAPGLFDFARSGSKSKKQVVVTACTLAISVCLQQLEIHHAHEVSMVPIEELCEASIGVGSDEPWDQLCVVFRRVDNRRLGLRLQCQEQVKPFISVLLALASIAKEKVGGCPTTPCEENPARRSGRLL